MLLGVSHSFRHGQHFGEPHTENDPRDACGKLVKLASNETPWAPHPAVSYGDSQGLIWFVNPYVDPVRIDALTDGPVTDDSFALSNRCSVPVASTICRV